MSWESSRDAWLTDPDYGKVKVGECTGCGAEFMASSYDARRMRRDQEHDSLESCAKCGKTVCDDCGHKCEHCGKHLHRWCALELPGELACSAECAVELDRNAERCEACHGWQTAGKDTDAPCPVCGGTGEPIPNLSRNDHRWTVNNMLRGDQGPGHFPEDVQPE